MSENSSDKKPSSASALIKNPLSIIAIFAGIAESVSAVALPFLTAENQAIFVWFLMLFPPFLVSLFFGTLWAKHQVLYAPSDYQDESNFFRGRPSSEQEIVAKQEQDINETEQLSSLSDDIPATTPEPHQDAAESSSVTHKEPTTVPSATSEIGTAPTNPEGSTKSFQFMNRDRYKALVAKIDDVLFEELESEEISPIRRNMTFKTVDGKTVVDGVVFNGKTVKLFETLIFPNTYASASAVRRAAERLSNRFSQNFEYGATNIEDTVILAVAGQPGSRLPKISKYDFGEKKFKVEVRYYSIPALEKKYMISLQP